MPVVWFIKTNWSVSLIAVQSAVEMNVTLENGNAAGLLQTNNGVISGSFATMPIVGSGNVSGLVVANSSPDGDGRIESSYAQNVIEGSSS